MKAFPKQSLPAVHAGIYTWISSDPSGQRASIASGPIAKPSAWRRV